MPDDDPRDRELDATTAALVITAMEQPLRASTVRTWVARGRLHPTGHDTLGRRTYRLGDVLDLAAARHAQKS